MERKIYNPLESLFWHDFGYEASRLCQTNVILLYEHFKADANAEAVNGCLVEGQLKINFLVI